MNEIPQGIQSNLIASVSSDANLGSAGASRVPERFRSITSPFEFNRTLISRPVQTNLRQFNHQVPVSPKNGA